MRGPGSSSPDAPEEVRASYLRGWFKTGDIGVSNDGFISADQKELILGRFHTIPMEARFAVIRQSNRYLCVVGFPFPDTTEEVVATIIMRQRATLEGTRLGGGDGRFTHSRQLVVIAELPAQSDGQILRRRSPSSDTRDGARPRVTPVCRSACSHAAAAQTIST